MGVILKGKHEAIKIFHTSRLENAADVYRAASNIERGRDTLVAQYVSEPCVLDNCIKGF